VKLPIPRGQLEVNIDGNLSSLRLFWISLKLEIWTCRGEKGSCNGVQDWVRTKIIVLKPKKPQKEIGDGTVDWLRTLTCMCVGERSGTLFIAGDRKLKYIVNLETEAVEKVPSQFCCLRKHIVVPFKMDWPAFFMSRLEAK
jgi:hypothetical protein